MVVLPADSHTNYMTHFLNRSLLLIGSVISMLTFAQPTNDALKKEVQAISGKEAIEAYWNAIHRDDQANRGPQADAQKDMVNFKKMMWMIYCHGYPECPVGANQSSETDSVKRRNFIPNVVFVHQPSFRVREYFFPVLYDAYKAGKADEFWFLHSVGSLTLGRFNRLFYAKTSENLNANLALLSAYLPEKGGFDMEVVDSLFAAEMSWRNQVISSEKLFSSRIKPANFRERIVRDQYLHLYRYEDRLFLQQVYLDGSYNAPQEILFDSEKQLFSYVQHDAVHSCESDLNRLLKKRHRDELRQLVVVLQQ